MEKSKKIDPNHNWSKPQKFFKKNPEMQENWNPFGIEIPNHKHLFFFL